MDNGPGNVCLKFSWIKKWLNQNYKVEFHTHTKSRTLLKLLPEVSDLNNNLLGYAV